MKSLAVVVPGSFLSAFPIPGRFRIAIPSWRSVGIDVRAENADEPSVSREELQSLFHGELNGKVSKKSTLTALEEREASLSKRIRSALYPSQSGSVQH